MCGITGLINLNGEHVSPIILQKMTDAIAHRGPDGEGQWIEGNVGLGHRRLAIIALILMSALRKQMRESGLIEHYTVRELLREMDTLTRINYSGKYGHILTELTKPQRQILKALDIPILDQSEA